MFVFRNIHYLFLVIALLIISNSYGQQAVIKVLDKITNDPVPYAHICFEAVSSGGNQLVSHSSSKPIQKNPIEEINILELLEKLKENKPDELIPKVDSIIYHITPLLKFLAQNARDELQAVLRKISSK